MNISPRLTPAGFRSGQGDGKKIQKIIEKKPAGIEAPQVERGVRKGNCTLSAERAQENN